MLDMILSKDWINFCQSERGSLTAENSVSYITVFFKSFQIYYVFIIRYDSYRIEMAETFILLKVVSTYNRLKLLFVSLIKF